MSARRAAAALLVFALAFIFLAGCADAQKPFVVVYTSQDQVYAEPILKEFTEKFGVEVRAVYDSEAVKTVGLVNRLIAEKNNPQCDVFWNNEEFRTRQLEQLGVLREDKPWAAFGFRRRCLVVHASQRGRFASPQTLSALTNAALSGKIAVAYPLFGSTSTHFLALRQHWGEERWQQWCRDLLANKPFIVDGNSVVVKLVASGEAWVGLTDTDDVAAALREGLPVVAVPLSEDGLVIPNTIGWVRGSRRVPAAEALAEFLQSSAVVERLIAAGALVGQKPEGAGQGIVVNWDDLLRDHAAAMSQLKALFLR